MFIPILAYHKIQDDFDLSVTRVHLSRFESQIQFLVEAGFQSVTIEELFKFRHRSDRKLIALTFDDAYRCVYDYAFPILREYGFKATLFVVTKYAGRWNTWDYQLFSKSRHCDWDQIRFLASQGWEIGSHSVSHPNLKWLAERELFNELHGSKLEIENQIQASVQTISYPFGKYDARVIRCVKMAGYASGCTLGHSSYQTQLIPYALFRRGVYCFESIPVFKLKLVNNFWSRCDDLKQKLITSCANGSTLLQYIRSR